MHTMTRKIMIATTTVILGLGGSALLTGTAFAGETHDCGCNTPSAPAPQTSAPAPSAPAHHTEHTSYTNGTGGTGGAGGQADSNCAVPIGVSAGVIGQGGTNSQCNAAGGAGGAGGTGIN